jgi:hypothetical protein
LHSVHANVILTRTTSTSSVFICVGLFAFFGHKKKT